MPWRIDVEDTNRALRASSYVSMISLALSFFIVLATYFIRSVPDARHHVDRISWRLFTKAMGVQMVFVVAYLVMYVRRDTATELSKSKAACTVGMMLTMGPRQAVSWLIASIAVNLALTVTWGIHAGRYHLERWYVGGSFALGFFPVIVGAARSTFGASKVYQICYFEPRDYRRYFIRAIFTYYLGMSVATAVSIIAVVIALTSIFKQARATRRLITLNIAEIPQRTPRAQALRRMSAGLSALPSLALASPKPTLPLGHAAALSVPARPPMAHFGDSRYTQDLDVELALVRSASTGRAAEIGTRADLVSMPLQLDIEPIGVNEPRTPRSTRKARSWSSFGSPFASPVRNGRKRSSGSNPDSEDMELRLKMGGGLVGQGGDINREAVSATGHGGRTAHSDAHAARKLLDALVSACRSIRLAVHRQTPPHAGTKRAPGKGDRSATNARTDVEQPRKISTYSLDDAFLGIALRVSVYPLVLIITNTLYISCDIFFYVRGSDLSDALLPLYFLNVAIYAGRGAIFALVGILVDPGFGKGLCKAVSVTAERWKRWRVTRKGRADREGQDGAREVVGGGASDADRQRVSVGGRGGGVAEGGGEGAEVDDDDLCSVREMFGMAPRRGAMAGATFTADEGHVKGDDDVRNEQDGIETTDDNDNADLQEVTGTLVSYNEVTGMPTLEPHGDQGCRSAKQILPTSAISYRNPFDAGCLPNDAGMDISAGPASTPVSPKTNIHRFSSGSGSGSLSIGLSALSDLATANATANVLVDTGAIHGGPGITRPGGTTTPTSAQMDVFGIVAVPPSSLVLGIKTSLSPAETADTGAEEETREDCRSGVGMVRRVSVDQL